jgi:pilus assembly protein Flp/PilA
VARREVIAVVLTKLALWASSLIHPDRDEDGQGLAEYALILALIAIVAIVALLFLGSQISDKFSVIGNQL